MNIVIIEGAVDGSGKAVIHFTTMHMAIYPKVTDMNTN